ncbi:hypothetical protein POM88_030181 [Heracleum sosnowskyi]|uniref:Uncharacterized protein n=1 Tax=Heracleum sosnowskyi TaxID=360622 RepID=A0AAD8HVZ7_9APIA|nr:hypothetical protein POM88_030181 [Heracleum sosnowskyi]
MSFGFSPSITSSTSPAFGQPSPAFGQTSPSFGQTSPAFGQTSPSFGSFGQTSPAFGQTSPSFGQTSPAFGQSSPPSFGQPIQSPDRKTDSSASKESKHQQKLQSDEMEKSVQLICKDVIRHQEDMKSWIERYKSLELEKIKDTRTINQLRDELAQVTRSKDAIIAEYLESPAFAKRLDEEYEKRLSEIFHPSYVKALRTVQNKLPEKINTISHRRNKHLIRRSYAKRLDDE